MKDEFKEILISKLSLESINDIAYKVIENPSYFKDIYDLTKENNRKIAWRALWACEKISLKMPSLYKDKYEDITDCLYHTSHEGMKRLYLSIILHLPLQPNIDVRLFNFCIDKIVSPNEKSSSQALCMKLAFRICIKEKELLKELQITLENIETSFYNAGALSARKSVLMKIKKINHNNKKDENIIY